MVTWSRRAACLAVLALAGPALALSPAPATAAASDAPARSALRNACILLESVAPEDAWRAAERLARLGVTDVSLEGPGVLEGAATDDGLAAARSAPGVRLLLVGSAGDDLLASVGKGARAALERWNGRLALAPAGAPDPASAKAAGSGGSAPPTATSLDEGDCIVLPPPAMPRELAKTATSDEDLPRFATYDRAWGAADYQTSEFLLGRVAVAIVTPQTFPQQWTRDELLAVQAAARGAMTYWRAQANNGKMPVYLAFEYLDSLASEYSVLTSPDDTRWVRPLMDSARERLGIAGKANAGKIPENSFPEVYQVLNYLRRKFVADWAVMFVVGHGDRFTESTGLSAYAYLGGPFLVTPNAPIRWDLTGLIVHESGHLFYALDEYCASSGNCGGTSSPCTALSGYLMIANRNSLNRSLGGCVQSPVPCAMNTPGLRSCTYTEGMMGIKDSDNDGILDILDTQPIAELFRRDGEAFLDSTGRRVLSDTIRTLTPLYEGFVREAPIPNRVVASGTGAGAASLDLSGGDPVAAAATARPSISMNVVQRGEYRIDGGTWIWIRPDSSDYDAPVEDFRLVPEGLSGGNHTIEIRGTNSAGNTTEPNATKKERVVVLAVAFDGLTLSQQREGGLDITWRVRGKAWDSIARLYRSEDGGPETLLATLPLADDAASSVLDAAVRPGHGYRYRVETTAFGKTYAVATDGVAAVPMPDPQARLSSACPNPFRDVTVLSFAVPQGVLGLRPPHDGGNKPGPPPILPPSSPRADLSSQAATADLTRLPVWASVSIHDVAGRAVRHLVEEALDGQRIYTYRWDGRDDRGNPLPTGVYFARLATGTYRDTSKLMLIR